MVDPAPHRPRVRRRVEHRLVPQVSAMIAGIPKSGEMARARHRPARRARASSAATSPTWRRRPRRARGASSRPRSIAGTPCRECLRRLLGRRASSARSPRSRSRSAAGAIEEEDIDAVARCRRGKRIEPDGRMVLHAQPALYTLDGADGTPTRAASMPSSSASTSTSIAADGAPVRNLDLCGRRTPISGSRRSSPRRWPPGKACLTDEERELGVALVELGARGHQRLGLRRRHAGRPEPLSRSAAADITDDDRLAPSAPAAFQAERIKCFYGSAMASPARQSRHDRGRGPVDDSGGPVARGADEQPHHPRRNWSR